MFESADFVVKAGDVRCLSCIVFGAYFETVVKFYCSLSLDHLRAFFFIVSYRLVPAVALSIPFVYPVDDILFRMEDPLLVSATCLYEASIDFPALFGYNFSGTGFSTGTCELSFSEGFAR